MTHTRLWHEPARPFVDRCHECGTVAPFAELRPAWLTFLGAVAIISNFYPREWWKCMDEFDCFRRRRMKMGPLPSGKAVEIA